MAGVLTPKRPLWLAWSSAIGAAIVIIFAVWSWLTPWQPGRMGGLIAGWAAAALFVNAALYPWRRRWHTWPLGTVQRWLQLHIYGSTVGALLAIVHVRFQLPAGAMGWWLLGLTIWTAGSGLVGVYLQKRLPQVMARQLRVEAIYERMPELVGQLAAEADVLMAGASEVATRTYQTEVRPMLAAPIMSWTHLLDVRGDRARVLDPLERLAAFLDDADRARLADLQTIVLDKLDLDAHMSLQRALRLWPLTHVPGAMVLLGLLVVHVFAVVYF